MKRKGQIELNATSAFLFPYYETGFKRLLAKEIASWKGSAIKLYVKAGFNNPR